MEYVAFGDESGTTGSDRCYGIGLLCVRKDTLHIFNERVQKLKDKYGIVGELKWSKIKNSAGQANICIELLAMVLKNSCCFHSIVVVKNMYNNWQTDRELAFYQTYTMLVKNVAKQIKSDVEVIIDQKIDKYKKNDEVTGIVANNMLARAGMKKLVKSVTMHDSKHHLGLQVVDILTGAVNSGYLKYLNPRLELSVWLRNWPLNVWLLCLAGMYSITIHSLIRILISGIFRKRCELCRVQRVFDLITTFHWLSGKSCPNLYSKNRVYA